MKLLLKTKMMFISIFFLCISTLSANIIKYYSYSPISQNISRAIEIDFYDDGLIKEIRKYVYFGEKHEDVDESVILENLTLTEIKTVVRKKNRIEIFATNVLNNESEKLYSTFEIDINNSNILYTKVYKENEKRIIQILDENGSFNLLSLENDISVEFKNESFLTTIIFHKINNYIEYHYSDNNILQSITINNNGIKEIINISNDNVNSYTIIQPVEDGPSSFNKKYKIDFSENKPSKINIILNYFLCPGEDLFYILPFLIHVFD